MNLTLHAKSSSRRARRWLPQLTRLDAIGMAIAAVTLLAGSLVAHFRVPYFWYDELATWTMVSDPSLPDMLRAIHQGTESNPPLYQLLLWLWSTVAGQGELSLRLPSALCMIAAMLVLWAALRHAYGIAPTALGIGVVFFGGQVILEQLSQARFYGMFALCVAIAIALAVRVAHRQEISRGLLAATLGAHVALVYSHVFGSFFSAAILVALMLADLRLGRTRVALYASIVGAWVLFLPWVPAILEQRTLAEGRSWLAPPTRDDLFAVVGRQTLWLPLAMAVGVLAAALRRDQRDVELIEARSGDSVRLTLVLLAVCLLAVLPAIFVLSRLVVPIFLDRYLLPSAFGWSVVVAHITWRLSFDIADGRRGRWSALASGLLFCTLATYPVVFALARPRATRPDLAVEAAHAALPVVVESGHQFWPLRHYGRRGGDRFRFLLDDEIAADPDNAAGALQEQKLMRLYADLGYLGASVEDGGQFLCAHTRFLVVDRPGFTWFERRVRDSTTYRWRTVGDHLDSVIQLVERIGPCAQNPRSR